MTTLELSRDEIRELLEVLEADLSDLRMEIADTDRMAYREKLKGRKRILITVLEKLGQAQQNARMV